MFDTRQTRQRSNHSRQPFELAVRGLRPTSLRGREQHAPKAQRGLRQGSKPEGPRRSSSGSVATRREPGARQRATPVRSLQVAANILRRFLIADDLKRVCWQHPPLDRFDLIGRRVQPFFTRCLAG